jgi:hypothetical protein
LQPLSRSALRFFQLPLRVTAQLLGNLVKLFAWYSGPLLVQASGTALDPLLGVHGSYE